MKKRGKTLDRIEAVVRILRMGEALPLRYRPHKLSGQWRGSWECHIEPDWLLIYDLEDELLTLRRTGTHSDLFGE